MPKQKIWCLFSVDNNYDQPDHNLVMWWAEKPSIEVLANALAHKFPASNDETTIRIVKIWAGEPQQLSGFDTRYRLEQLNEGENPSPAI